jgi:hypothetical protein
MPALSIDISEDGKIAGELPEALKTALDAQIQAQLKAAKAEIHQTAFNEGFAKGNAKKADELRPLIADPAEKERLKTLEQENEKLKIAELERQKNYEEANRLREERYQKDLREKDEAITKRQARLRDGAIAKIEAAATKFGARDESLGELSLILGGEIDFDADLAPFVKGRDGQPAVDAKGQPLTIEGRVRQYLDANRHHLKGPGGSGGGAKGGASFDSLSDAVSAAQARFNEAQKALQQNPSDNAAVLELRNASKALAEAKAKG